MHGNPDAYVLSDRWKAPAVRAQPYLLSAQEIDRFFTAAAQLQRTVPVALASSRVLHADALVRDANRGSPRSSRPSSVDLRDGHVDVLWSKGTAADVCP